MCQEPRARVQTGSRCHGTCMARPKKVGDKSSQSPNWFSALHSHQLERIFSALARPLCPFTVNLFVLAQRPAKLRSNNLKLSFARLPFALRETKLVQHLSMRNGRLANVTSSTLNCQLFSKDGDHQISPISKEERCRYWTDL